MGPLGNCLMRTADCFAWCLLGEARKWPRMKNGPGVYKGKWSRFSEYWNRQENGLGCKEECYQKTALWGCTYLACTVLLRSPLKLHTNRHSIFSRNLNHLRNQEFYRVCLPLKMFISISYLPLITIILSST